MRRLQHSILRGVLACLLVLPLANGRAHAQDQPAWVPPYPGPVPISWPSVQMYEQYAQTRAQQLEARQQGLASAAGRVENYQLKRVGLFTAMLVGAGMAVGGYVIFMSRPSDDPASPSTSRAITALMLGGAGLTLAAGVGVHSLKRRNPYNEEIEHLQQERLYWRREARRVRRERERRGFDLSFTGFGLYASF